MGSYTCDSTRIQSHVAGTHYYPLFHNLPSHPVIKYVLGKPCKFEHFPWTAEETIAGGTSNHPNQLCGPSNAKGESEHH